MCFKRIAFPSLIVAIAACVGYFSWVKYSEMKAKDDYSLEHVLRNTKKVKNKPLVSELFRLGTPLKDIRNQKTGAVADNARRSDLILLTKICKDSCKAIRCRIDPGIGHACRINCPQKKIRFCVLATKPIPDEVN